MRKLLLIAGISLLISSCSTVVAPGYTTVSKIYKLKKGMKPKEVEYTLEAPPFDLLVNVENGLKVIEYKYVHHHLKVFGNHTSAENLNQGSSRYMKPGDLFLVFDQKSGELLYFYTSTGMGSSRNALNQMNQILNKK